MKPSKSFLKNFKNIEVRYIVNILGYTGLLPFLLILFLLKTQTEQYQTFLISSFFSYTSIILTFLGAIYWGFALTNKNVNFVRTSLILSVLPAILAWATNSLVHSLIPKTILFLIFYNSIYILERTQASKIKIPKFYISSRFVLNTLVSIILLVFLFIIKF